MVATEATAAGKKPAAKTAAGAAKKTAGGGGGGGGGAKDRESLFVSKPRTFGIGGAVQHSRDLTRFVRWPRYVRIQRQRRILLSRLKVPPAIAQFSRTLERNANVQLFKLLDSLRPEDRKAKAARLRAAAEAKAAAGKAGQAAPALDAATKPHTVKYGISHITQLVESKKARLVVIAADVDPIEIVVWLPALCCKMGVPYCIVKGGRSRLGAVCRKKTASAVAVTSVPKDKVTDLTNLVNVARDMFNNQYEATKRTWGGSVPSAKSKAKTDRAAKAK